MAYIPLSQRVAARMAEIEKKEAPASEPFSWNTPERTRNMARQSQTPKKQGGFGMTNAQIIRALRKGNK